MSREQEEKRRVSEEEGRGDKRMEGWEREGLQEQRRQKGRKNMEVEMCEQRTGTRERRGNWRSDSTAGGRLSRGAPVDCTAHTR